VVIRRVANGSKRPTASFRHRQRESPRSGMKWREGQLREFGSPRFHRPPDATDRRPATRCVSEWACREIFLYERRPGLNDISVLSKSCYASTLSRNKLPSSEFRPRITTSQLEHRVRLQILGGFCAMTAIRIVGRTLVLSILLLCLGSAVAQDIRIAVVGSMTGPLASPGMRTSAARSLPRKTLTRRAASTAEVSSSALRTTPAIPNKPFQSPTMSSVSRSPLWTATPARTLLFRLPRFMPSMACL
jgi:hypothetical protein